MGHFYQIVSSFLVVGLESAAQLSSTKHGNSSPQGESSPTGSVPHEFSAESHIFMQIVSFQHEAEPIHPLGSSCLDLTLVSPSSSDLIQLAGKFYYRNDEEDVLELLDVELLLGI